MRGKHSIIVTNNKLRYELIIKRNITIIKGDSGTGKTTLIDMLRQYTNLGESSGINVSCDVNCRVLEGQDWKLLLTGIKNSILFIDEENKFINTEEFAAEVKKSENYFVLITRENLYNLPYSVEEIYGIHTSGKYHDTRKVYQQLYQIYPKTEQMIRPNRIVVEDSNSGYEFFQYISENKNILCESANGKSNIRRLIGEDKSREVCVIADGAAIGPEMQQLYNIVKKNKNIKLYLPESFEWLILKSGLIDDRNIKEMLSAPEEYIESSEYFSWERYFTKVLTENTMNTPFQYHKKTLNPVYLHEKSVEAILKSIEGIDFTKQE